MRTPALVALLAWVTTACAPIPPEVASPFDDYANWYLKEDLRYDILDPADNNYIVVPAGFVTDYASIPRSLCLFMPKDGRHSRAAIIHDYLYWHGEKYCTREQADQIMYLAMVELGVDVDRRKTIYAQLKNFGGAAWKENARNRQTHQRVLPISLMEELGDPNLYPDADSGETGLRTWKQYRERVREYYLANPDDHSHAGGEVNVNWDFVTAQFENERTKVAPAWWEFWQWLKFWQW